MTVHAYNAYVFLSLEDANLPDCLPILMLAATKPPVKVSTGHETREAADKATSNLMALESLRCTTSKEA